jgi:hypothetical protein
MRQITKVVALATVAYFSLTGCESHQHKVDTLQAEYERLEAQFRKDCTAEYFKAQPTLNQKCTDEDKKAKDAWTRLQAERAKK